jgi:hypothetical protein
MERVLLSIVIIEELLESKGSCSGLENRLKVVRTRCADHAIIFYPQKLALTSPTSVGRSVGIVCGLSDHRVSRITTSFNPFQP